MAFTSKDGSRFTNKDTMRQHDARSASKSAVSGPPASAAGQDVSDPTAGQEQDPAAVAAEHGPAVEVSVHHDHEGGHHSVHSKHGDGHEHESDHASAAEAYQAAGALGGVGAEGGAMGGGDAMAGGPPAMGSGMGGAV